MELLSEVGIFTAKIMVVVIALLVVIAAIAALRSRSQASPEGQLSIRNLTRSWREEQSAMEEVVLDKSALKKKRKQEKKDTRAREKARKANENQANAHEANGHESAPPSRLFVIDFHGDLRASAVHRLGKEVTAILGQAEKTDEVLLRLESTGGMVHAYGLAAAQLQRIRDSGIHLTIAVDKVAASGGYLMACLADRLIAAPFAILGSIGVIAQIPNFNKLLKKHDIDIEMHTAGEFKRTLTLTGVNTERGRKKFVEDLEKTHSLFKAFVTRARPAVDMKKVGTGEIWYASEAQDLGLVDAIETSDAWLFKNLSARQAVYQVRWIPKHSLARKLTAGAENALTSSLVRLWEHLTSRRFPE